MAKKRKRMPTPLEGELQTLWVQVKGLEEDLGDLRAEAHRNNEMMMEIAMSELRERARGIREKLGKIAYHAGT